MQMVELELISVSNKVGCPADCDLLIDVGAKELPDFSLEDCWKDKFITPLRDRLMIEWLFSQHGAKIQLLAIESQITKLIKQHIVQPSQTANSTSSDSEKQSLRMRVGISCKNGAQLSPCFVEQLYDNLQCEPPLEGLVVRRHHWDALSGEWGKRKDMVWQHSRLPIKYTREVRQAVHNQMWTNFPIHVNTMIEDAFQRAPTGSDIEIDGGFTINFEAGTVFMRSKREVYRIRSTVVSADALLKCYPLVGETYKSLVKRYQAAGILFYSVHPVTGEAVFLLGHIIYASCSWCDFGGLRNNWERARYTAARECCEETLGVLGSKKSLVARLEDYKTNNAFKIVNEDTRYVSHLLRVGYHDYPTQFKQTIVDNNVTHLEVDQMRWFPMSSMKTAIQMALLDQSHITVHPIHKDGSVDTSQSLPLRTEFVHTMCMANSLGFLRSIEHITKELHSKDPSASPHPHPYVSIPNKARRQERTSKHKGELATSEVDHHHHGQLGTIDSTSSEILQLPMGVGQCEHHKETQVCLPQSVGEEEQVLLECQDGTKESVVQVRAIASTTPTGSEVVAPHSSDIDAVNIESGMMEVLGHMFERTTLGDSDEEEGGATDYLTQNQGAIPLPSDDPSRPSATELGAITTHGALSPQGQLRPDSNYTNEPSTFTNDRSSPRRRKGKKRSKETTTSMSSSPDKPRTSTGGGILYYGMGAGRFIRNAYKGIY